MLPVLYAKTKNGNIKWYTVEIRHFAKHSEIHRIKASKIGGKSQTDITEITSGVNIGKKNETTIRQQADLVAHSIMNSLRDEGYKTAEELGLVINKDTGTYTIKSTSEYNTDASGHLKPMLAKDYDDVKNVEFPLDAQPKFNGVRCTVTRTASGLTMRSRNGKYYYIERVFKELMKILKPGQSVDGELCSTKLTFQGITKAVKTMNFKHPDQDKIHFVIFDVPVQGVPWFNRSKLYQSLKFPPFSKSSASPVVLSPVTRCANMEALKRLHKTHTLPHFDGTILRVLGGRYEFGFRSAFLIKFKDMRDAEFWIIHVNQATGRDKGSAVFLCTKDQKAYNAFKKNPALLEDKKWLDEHTFGCRPEGSLAERKRFYRNRKKCVNKKLTVRFQNFSDDMKPIFPVGVAIRDYE